MLTFVQFFFGVPKFQFSKRLVAEFAVSRSACRSSSLGDNVDLDDVRRHRPLLLTTFRGVWGAPPPGG
ncbi:hypothetical protein BST37_05915 [Mycobacterium noviomagense]|uniref:Secreted protein n=1 Tax=Mycobacterium noviomagense TaxID=459858 RepID=A0ABX3T8F6_9MYCO|nr:hypothetical protein BST37_05915 [Mycobacterium noviomagense]